jgi:hypothetical protein
VEQEFHRRFPRQPVEIFQRVAVRRSIKAVFRGIWRDRARHPSGHPVADGSLFQTVALVGRFRVRIGWIMRKEDRKPAAWGSFSLLATILGVVVPMRYPTFAPELLTMVFWGGIVGIGGCSIWLLYEHLNEAWQNWWRERRMTPLIGIIACSIGLAVFLALFLRQQNQSIGPSDIRPAEIEAKQSRFVMV